MKKHTTMRKWIIVFLTMCLMFPSVSVAQSLRQLTMEDGLASSAVTCVHQSRDGLLWFGTLDGMNVYYGQQVHRTTMIPLGALEGHIIEEIIDTADDYMWMQTSYGLHQLERLTRKTNSFYQFTGVYRIRLIGKNQVMVQDTDARFHIYQAEEKRFVPVDYTPMEGESLQSFGGTEDFCWVAGNKGIYRYSWTNVSSETPALGNAVCLLEGPVKYAQTTDNPEVIYVIDEQNRLYKWNIRQNEKTYVLEFEKDLSLLGDVSSIVESKGTYFISFKVGGVMKYSYDTRLHHWVREDLGVKSGVFQMKKDINQELIWIATDGQGVFAYWEGAYSIRSYRYSDFSYLLGKPVRALFVDDKEWLWLGTKGEGLVGIDRSDKKREIHLSSQRILTSSNSALENNSVYALSASNHQGFWVGSEEGINFYQYASRTLQDVVGGREVKYVHSIQEVGDSVLWIATVGQGVYKASIRKQGNTLHLEQFRHFEVGRGHFSSNYFFAMHYTDEGDLWLGNRGHGVFKMYPYGLEPTIWPNKQFSPLQNEVFALYEHQEVLWVGTSCGLLGLGKDGKEWYIDKEDGLPNNIVRSLQVDEKNGLWVATNNGLARLDAEFNEIKTFGRRDGLKVTEFSDGASLRTKDALYFGAVDGWAEINNHIEESSDDAYNPPLYFVHFSGVKERQFFLHLHTMNAKEGEIPEMELERDENAFSISFMAMDYINLGDYRYSYKIDSDVKGNWIDNGALNQISLAQMMPGHYLLHVKYHNNITGHESEPVRLKIHIKPYWWQSSGMIILYWSVFLIGIAYISVMAYRRSKRRHAYALQTLEQQHKEEIYEEKLRFFTNITHEFSTPLTLIYGPCERLLAYKGSDDYIRRYVLLVKKHTERLYQLIQEIIDYRRIETKHQQLNLEHYNLSEYIHESCDIFADLAEKNEVCLMKEIEEEVFWNMDQRCFPKVLANLLSNAMKYTPKGGTVKVSFGKLSEDRLQLKVYNTGKGIKEEDRIRIFNRYSVLDEVEENASNILRRNGLGMAICHSSVQLLGGTIEINSVVGEYAEFVVTLPLLPLPEGASEGTVKDVVPLSIQNQMLSEVAVPELVEEKEEEKTSSYLSLPPEDRSVVLVVDDNKDVLYLLREALSRTYEVKTAKDADEALAMIREVTPDLIVTDVMMPGTTDGMGLTRQIKQNKHTMHVPMVILSARNTDDAKTEGMLAGADAYIGKPFNVQYLIAVVTRLIESRKNMKEYYNTSASAYSYVEGQLIKAEDKEFLYRLNEVVEQNLNNASLTTEVIADALNMSSRSLYRRLKELQLPSPKDYVKEQKMAKAVKLLQTSSMSIQEIIYECGFNNRAHFYKDFSKRYGVTPKEFRMQTKNQDVSLIAGAE